MFKGIAAKVTCADGVTLSVQASRTHYCTPRVDEAEYTHKEVGFIEDENGKCITPPESWRQHTDGDNFPNDVYGYVPVALIEEFIAAHGGRK